MASMLRPISASSAAPRKVRRLCRRLVDHLLLVGDRPGVEGACDERPRPCHGSAPAARDRSGEPLDIAEPSGTVGRALPGETGSSTFPVESGTYVVLCLVDTDDPDFAASYLAQPPGVTVSE